MDVHRCRFVPYPPSAINALAFSHPSSLESKHKGPSTLRLAIGRANGDIEIWNPQKGLWFQESVLKGGKDRSIEGLVWTLDPEGSDKFKNKLPGKLRLFSIGYSTAVTEWNLATGRPARHCTGNYGEIWCIAAQPRSFELSGLLTKNEVSGPQETNSQYQDIAVGCADGAVVLLSTADEDLQFLRKISTSSSGKARVLSITYQKSHIVVTGHADSTIRVFDVNSRQLLRSMSLGAGPVGGPKEVLVWSVKCVSDRTIISGDSTGTVRFWDGQTYTLTQRIKGHVADILDVAVSADGKSVWSGGMDRRTTLYRRIAAGKGVEHSRWKEIAHRRFHKHDVKALATYETKDMSVLVSGGLDTKPVIVPIREFGKEYHRTLSALPQQPPVCSAPNKRLMVSWWDRKISMWKVPNTQKSKYAFETDAESDGEPRMKVMSKIQLQGEESITGVDVSADGSLLVAATSSQIKMFLLLFRTKSTLKIGRFDLPAAISSSGANIVRFSPDRRWLLIVRLVSDPKGRIELHRITEDGRVNMSEKSVLLKRMKRPQEATHPGNGTHGSYDRTISRVAFSADSRILAVSDFSACIDSWVLEGYEDLTQRNALDKGASTSEISGDEDSDADEEENPLIIFGQHWIKNPAGSLIPKLDATPLVFSFRPSAGLLHKTHDDRAAVHATRNTPHPHSHALPDGEDRLFVLTSEHRMHEFEVLAGRLTDWSRRNPSASLPPRFRNTQERAMGIVWDIKGPKERIWLYGSSWLWMFDLSQDLTDPSFDGNEPQQSVSDSNVIQKRRRRPSLEQQYQPIAHRMKKSNTGAGDQIPDMRLRSGIGRKLRKFNGTETNFIDLGQEQTQASEDDEDDDMDRSALVGLRRGLGEESHGAQVVVWNGDQESNDDRSLFQPATSSSPRSWSTYQYRSILSIVPLSADDESKGQTEGCDNADPELEVALIERPVEEADLPARFYGNQEWDE